MKAWAILAVFAFASVETLWGQDATSTPRWRLGLGAGVYQVDDLVGTPLVPMARVGRAIGSSGIVAIELVGIINRGFYSANAVAGDLDIGLRLSSSPAEFTFTAGPSGILGGDSDGTPYVGGGLHGAVGATVWITPRVGIGGKFRVRHWWGIANSVLAGGTLGVELGL